MILIRQLGFSLMLALTVFCYPTPYHPYFSSIKKQEVLNYNATYSEFCSIDESDNYESNAIICSVFGDYAKTIDFATKNAKIHSPMTIDEKSKNSMINYLESKENSFDSLKSRKIMDLLRPKNLNEIFRDKKRQGAKDFILAQSKKFHFLLINEAHYSSQNRAFTRDLLKPLWEQGYRYLALEALWYEDTLLIKRGYPNINTGYYIKDPVFGNLIREALKIGYKLVAYETTSSNDGTLRDSDQANNIYKNTLKNDPLGKVIIHAGYSHISETGDVNYEPMGYQLKKLTNQDILTIDQQNMTELRDVNKIHPYYKYATNNYELKEPMVFTDDNGQVLVDPINSFGIDIQVYHPLNTYVKGRPSWLLNDKFLLYDLPDSFKKYNGFLLQAFSKNEDASAIPIDQFVIQPGKALALPKGEYSLKLINCEGTLKGTSNLEIR